MSGHGYHEGHLAMADLGDSAGSRSPLMIFYGFQIFYRSHTCAENRYDPASDRISGAGQDTMESKPSEDGKAPV